MITVIIPTLNEEKTIGRIVRHTLLWASFIHTAAEKFKFKKNLIEIITTQSNPFIRTKQIAKLLKGKSIGGLLKVADEIPVAANIKAAIALIKENGFVLGIISDSYDCITNHFKNVFSFDFSLANKLEFSRNIATGAVKIPSFFLSYDESICNHEYCKTHALVHNCSHFNVPVSDTLSIGDGENDICMIKKSGIGVAFCSSHSVLDAVADYVIKEADSNLLFPLILKHDNILTYNSFYTGLYCHCI